MKLVYPDIHQVIRFQNGKISSLVIENPTLMMRFLSDIQNQILGEAGRVVLSLDDTPVSIERWVDLLVDFPGFDGDRKSLMTKFLHVMERTAQEAQYLQDTQKLMASIEKYMDLLAYDQDVYLRYDKMSFSNLLKAVGIHIVIDYNNLAELLLSYMKLVIRFEGEKVFLLVNLRSFVSDEDMVLFTDTVVQHGMKVLLVDNHADTLLPLENRVLVDRDLCEI